MHQYHEAAAEQPRCVNCSRVLHSTEATRWACTGCQQTAGQQLRELPGLYEQLDDTLAPSPSGGWFITGSRGAATSRPPGGLHHADLTDGLRGGVLATLVSCVRDWVETGGHDYPDWPADPAKRIGVLCGWLRFHLDWACGMHPGVGDSLRDITDLHRQVHGSATGERPERRVTVRCGCGGLLRVGISTHGATCPSCQRRYGHTEVLALPLAERRAAAA